MKKLRVLLAFEVEGEREPVERYEEYMHTEESWHTEGHVLDALRANGHEVYLGPLHKNPRELVDRIEEVRPDVVWNSLEAPFGRREFEGHAAALLEMLRVPYTGCGMLGLVLCKDKALTKKILRHHRVPVPAFATSRRVRPLRRVDPELLPAFVKPLAGEGSEGISRESFAETAEDVLRRVEFVNERLGQDAIVERYLPGREIYLPVLGNARPVVLPPRELRFAKVPEGEPTYASRKAKFDTGYRERWGIESLFPEELPPGVERELARIGKRLYRALQLRGYARVDLRLAPDGALHVVEANPNPEIARGEDFAESAARAGMPYGELVDRILRLALAASAI